MNDDYKIVQAIDHKELEKEINALKKKEDYHCIGGITSAGIYLYALMEKEKVAKKANSSGTSDKAKNTTKKVVKKISSTKAK